MAVTDSITLEMLADCSAQEMDAWLAGVASPVGMSGEVPAHVFNAYRMANPDYTPDLSAYPEQFTGRDLSHYHLAGAFARGGNFTGTVFGNVEGTDLGEAVLNHANFTRASFLATNITGSSIEGTRWPAHTGGLVTSEEQTMQILAQVEATKIGLRMEDRGARPDLNMSGHAMHHVAPALEEEAQRSF